jgi:hypothetical protein
VGRSGSAMPITPSATAIQPADRKSSLLILIPLWPEMSAFDLAVGLA